jgi:hypothetical protein
VVLEINSHAIGHAFNHLRSPKKTAAYRIYASLLVQRLQACIMPRPERV